MSVGVCLATTENNILSEKLFKHFDDLSAMPVPSPRRFSTATGISTSTALTGSYRSTSSLDRPFYSSATGSYVNSRSSYLSRNLDNRAFDSKRVFSRHTSISEDSGISSRAYSRSERSESRESSIRRGIGDTHITTRRDSGLSSVTGRRISSISVANSVDDIRQKYSPSNYTPKIRKPETNLDINRSKSISNDIGKPPVESNDTRPPALIRKNKVTNSNDNMPNNSLSVLTTNANVNRKIDGSSVEKIAKTSSSVIDEKVATWTTEDVESPIDDDNGNITQSVSEIRKKFDSPPKVTSVVVPSFVKNAGNSGKYDVTQVNNKTNELSVSCQNLKLSNKNDHSQNNGNSVVRWTFLSSNGDTCDSTDKDNAPNHSDITDTQQQPSTSKKTSSNHTSNFASYIPVNIYETKPVTSPDQQDNQASYDQQNIESPDEVETSDSPVVGDLAMSRDYSRRTNANRATANETTTARYNMRTSPTLDLTTSPRLNRSTITASSASNGSTTTLNDVSTVGRSTLEKHRDTSYGPQNYKNLGLNGLRNIGNTCFMNSVIQCLSNTRYLLEYLRDNAYLNDINTSTSSMKGALVKAFANVIQELWSTETDKIVNTTALKSQIQRFAPRFMGYAQQDAQEFLRFFLEGLHEDVNRITVRPTPILTEIDEKLSDSQKASEAWSRYLRIDNSAIVDIFVGQLKSTLRCSVCNYCSVTFDPFWDLSLPVASTLTQCLENFTKEETLDGPEKPTCSKCQQRRKCFKSFSIQKFPKILVLHLKRFSPTERFRGKLSTLIDFPLIGLDLSPFAASQGNSCVYNLYAISNHSGTTYSGHYTAYCKHPYSGEWHQYNDSRVSPISSRNVVSSEAYVLFYELAGHNSHL